MSLIEKIEQFNELCGDWDFRNIDMTSPHLQGIDIEDDKVHIYFELFSSELDEYISCDEGLFSNKKLVNKFKQLDLRDYISVNAYIKEIENVKVNIKMSKKLKIKM